MVTHGTAGPYGTAWNNMVQHGATGPYGTTWNNMVQHGATGAYGTTWNNQGTNLDLQGTASLLFTPHTILNPRFQVFLARQEQIN